MKVRLAPDVVRFNMVPLNTISRQSWQLLNDTACPISFKFGAAMKAAQRPAFQTVCFKGGPVAPGDFGGCRVELNPTRPGFFQHRIRVTISRVPWCATQLRVDTEELWDKEVSEVEDEIEALKKAGDGSQSYQDQLKLERERHQLALKQAKDAIFALKQDWPPLTTIELELEALKSRTLPQLQSKQKLIDELVQRGPNIALLQDALKAERIKHPQRSAIARRNHVKVCDKIAQLMNEKEKVLEEMRGGFFCSVCNRSASEIEKAEHVSLDVHVNSPKVNGRKVSASSQLILNKQKSFDAKIQKAEDQCKEAKRSWIKKQAKLDQTHEANLKSIQGKAESQSKVRQTSSSPSTKRASKSFSKSTTSSCA